MRAWEIFPLSGSGRAEAPDVRFARHEVGTALKPQGVCFTQPEQSHPHLCTRRVQRPLALHSTENPTGFSKCSEHQSESRRAFRQEAEPPVMLSLTVTHQTWREATFILISVGWRRQLMTTAQRKYFQVWLRCCCYLHDVSPVRCGDRCCKWNDDRAKMLPASYNCHTFSVWLFKLPHLIYHTFTSTVLSRHYS